MLSITMFILADAGAGGGELSTWFMGIIGTVVATLMVVYQHVNTREKKPEKTPAEQLKEMLELMQVMQAMQHNQTGGFMQTPPPYPPQYPPQNQFPPTQNPN